MRQGKCLGCGKCGWVNWYIPPKPDKASKLQHKPQGEYCADCFDLHSLEALRPPRATSASRDDISPWQENVIREYEDRYGE